MCLYIHDYHLLDLGRFDKRGNPAPLVAEDDFIVWKTLRAQNGKWVSPLRGEPYTFSKPMHASKLGTKLVNKQHIVEEGLHAHVVPNKGKNLDIGCFPALLARGTEFFFGKGDEIVATKLTVFKSMKDLRSYVSHHQ